MHLEVCLLGTLLVLVHLCVSHGCLRKEAVVDHHLLRVHCLCHYNVCPCEVKHIKILTFQRV